MSINIRKWLHLAEKHSDHPDYKETLHHIFEQGREYIHTHGEQMWWFGFLIGLLSGAIIAVTALIFLTHPSI